MKGRPRHITIYIDISSYIATPQSGVGQYSIGVIRSLLGRYHIVLLGFRDDTIILPDDLCGLVDIECLPMPRSLYVRLWKLGIPVNVYPWLQHKNATCILYPNFAMIPYIANNAIRSVTIIHDLAYKHFPETIEKKNLFFLTRAVPHTIRHSDVIVAPSDFTRHDIIKNFPLRQDKNIVVAYPGYDETIYTPDAVDSVGKNPFILFLATIEPRKNIVNLVKAFQALGGTRFTLVVAGKRGWGEASFETSHRVIVLGEVSDSQREWLLRRCSGVAFPSLFEGFGMPVIEAMRHRKPVLTSDSSSLREIASQDTAYIVSSPYAVNDILYPLRKMVQDIESGAAAKKTERGYNSSLQYTWDNTARVFCTLIDGATSAEQR